MGPRQLLHVDADSNALLSSDWDRTPSWLRSSCYCLLLSMADLKVERFSRSSGVILSMADLKVQGKSKDDSLSLGPESDQRWSRASSSLSESSSTPSSSCESSPTSIMVLSNPVRAADLVLELVVKKQKKRPTAEETGGETGGGSQTQRRCSHCQAQVVGRLGPTAEPGGSGLRCPMGAVWLPSPPLIISISSPSPNPISILVMKVPKGLPRCSTMDNLPHKMPRKALFALTICFLSLIPIIEGADPNYLFMECPNATLSTTSTYTANSTYQKNLNTMLSGLSSNSNNASNGFYNFTAGSSPPDVAYGLFICRGDLPTGTCRDCVTYAAGDVVERCPGSKRVTIWYDECILRYSNVSIFSVLDISYRRTLRNPQNATNATGFTEALGVLMDDLSARASSHESGRKFATGELNYSALQPLYGLAQCTPDLSVSDCNTCLRTCISIFPSCCGANIGARVLFPSCYVNYEVYPFYNASVGAAPPPPSPALPPPPGSTTTSSSEYVMHGQFSVKSDVFSFGVLVLEIISGQKNNNFSQSDGAADLLSYAWKLWKEGVSLDLMDPTLEGSHSRNEVTRCIHIALLCVQDDPDARPSMATVVLMLNSYSATLSIPQEPAFFVQTKTGANTLQGLESDQSTSKSMPWSVNEASITELEPR
ncbi:hypothetical protein RHSIM_Rhsim13G0159900 [Rhododendron simsii]|uniref:Gnk2-homologous domain-containing protein n=1 Tax=Rhododendron simsii TaxID=118357 RepID=A0A834G1Z7_RHOSS|nr:hypothetical protein RHSIM_Rhsim13G0159900 [Rhododendron simsii]